MSEKKSSPATSGGISGTTLLGVLFVGLKLTGHIDWSWWYVTLPFWGPLALILAALAVVLAAGLIWEGIGLLVDSKKKGKG